MTVQPSAEISGIDIRYRVQYGNSVSGNVVTASTETDARAFTMVELYSASNGSPINSDNIRPGAGSRGFSIAAVPDGEYELIATMQALGNSTNRATLRSNPMKVTVKGNDISGLTLKLQIILLSIYSLITSIFLFLRFIVIVIFPISFLIRTLIIVTLI